MPKIVTPLKDTQIKAFKLESKPYTKAYETKLWKFYYRSLLLHKRRKTSFETDSDTTLKIAHEKSNFKHKIIEVQLTHSNSIGNLVSQEYNRAKYFNERVELMQCWSDYLEGLVA